jgi:hypothetical protein
MAGKEKVAVIPKSLPERNLERLLERAAQSVKKGPQLLKKTATTSSTN